MMKNNNYLVPALIATAVILWVFMILAGTVHSFLPIVPALSFWQVVILNLFAGLAKFLFFGFSKQK